MRANLKTSALVCQIFGVSDRATAMIATSVLKDVGLVSPDASKLVTDRSKIKRDKKKARQEVKNQAQQNATYLFLCILIDERVTRLLKSKKEQIFIDAL